MFDSEESVMFRASLDGSTQRYVELWPAGLDRLEPLDVMLVFHGHGTNRWIYVRDDRDECRTAREAAVRHGMLFVSHDYRGTTSWMGPAGESDTLDVIADVKRRHRVRRMMLVGASMGGSAVLTFGILHPELVDGIVSQNGTANFLEFQNFREAISEAFGGSDAERPDEYRRRSAELHAENLTMPVALTVGGRDESVPPDSVLRLAAALKRMGRTLLLIYREDGGHSTDAVDTAAAIDFVVKSMKG